MRTFLTAIAALVAAPVLADDGAAADRPAPAVPAQTESAPIGREDPAARVVRVARSLLIANVGQCPHQRWDFGFAAHRDRPPLPEGAAPAPGAAAEPDGFRVVRVDPAGPVGLAVGDRVLAVNGAAWNTAAFAETFRKAEAAQPEVERLALQLRRGSEPVNLSVAGVRACAIPVLLAPRGRVNASASATTVFINSGLEQAMVQDDELAAVIAHELAHVLLGHGAAPAGPGASRPKRADIEQAADALGVRLMLRAGIDPEAAVRAIGTSDRLGRGPLSRMLGLYGSYLPTAQRQQFLRDQAARAREEQAAEKDGKG